MPRRDISDHELVEGFKQALSVHMGAAVLDESNRTLLKRAKGLIDAKMDAFNLIVDIQVKLDEFERQRNGF